MSMIPVFCNNQEYIAVLLDGSPEHGYPGLLELIAVEKPGWQTPKYKLAKLEKWLVRKQIDKTLYKFTHLKNLTGKMDSFWKVRSRALEATKECSKYCDSRHVSKIQNEIADRLMKERVQPVVRGLEKFKNNEEHWRQLMKKNLTQVNKNKKERQTEIKKQENTAKEFLGTQKAYESAQAEDPGPPPELTIEQQLILLDLALEEEHIKTEEMIINNFIPGKN
jgi:hypothetical protein